jgi:biotin carboxylase
MGRRIAILHHRRSFFALELRRAIGEDLEPIWVRVGDCAEDAGLRRLLERSGPVLAAPGVELDTLAERLRALSPQGIVTFVDDALCLTAALAARLGLPYHSEAVAATLADKIRQRAALDAAGIPGPRFWELGAELAGAPLAGRAHEIDYPAVLKPAVGSGSRGLRAVANASELLREHVPGTACLVEEYLPDPPDHDARFAAYLSIESVVSHGRICHATTCGRFPLAHPFRETGNFIPAALGPAGFDELAALTDASIRALEIHTGIMHTEIKLTEAGPKVIEINGRLGGRPPFVLQSVSDINLFRAACEVALGEDVIIPGPVPTREVGFWWMLQPPEHAAAVRAVHGADELRAVRGVDTVHLHRRPGDPVDWREGTAGQIVTVRGRAPDLETLAATIAALERTLEVDWVPATTPVSGAPLSEM